MKTMGLSPEVHNYLLSVSLREHPVLQKIRQDTASHPLVAMQIVPEQGQLLDFLVRLVQARRVLEIGVFTGYSSTCMALALPDQGQLHACELNPEFAQLARGYWQEAGVEGKIQLHPGPATTTLQQLQERAEVFDLAFIDADKLNMGHYFEQCLQLVRPGGLIVIDNVLWSGRVADPQVQDPDTQAIRQLNARLHNDSRIDLVMLGLADGITLARVRP